MQNNLKRIRLATPKDSSMLRNIYGQYIHTPITFECDLPCQKEFAQRIRDILLSYPYLVGEENGQVIGYAYAHRQMERKAYQWNAELSVYLDESFTSKGWGKRLYSALIDILKLQGVRTVYGGVTLPNSKSEGLHRSLGFTPLGTYHNTGYKCGKWHHVMWFEKPIGSYDKELKPIVPIGEISEKRIQEILYRCVSF